MANLFDGIKRIQRKELEEQLAGFEVYRIWVYACVLARKGLIGLVWLWQKIMRLFHKEIRLPEADSLELRFQKIKTELSYLSEEEFKQRMDRRLRRKVQIAGKIGRRVGKTEDGFSASITRAVERMWKKHTMHGFSVAEKNDFMFRDYPNRKKKTALFQLRMWMAGVFVIAGLCLTAAVLLPAVVLPVLAVGAAMEIVWLFFCARRLARRQLAHFLWLASSGLGKPFAIEKEVTPTNRLSLEERSRFDKEQRVYRTLHKRRILQEDQCRLLVSAQKECEKTIEQNRKKIQELQLGLKDESADVIAEKQRMQEDKRLENEKLLKEYNDRQKLLQKQQERLQELQQMEKEREVYEIEKLGKLWKDAYPDFSYETVFLEQLVMAFSFEDLERVEQRMEELKCSHDPFALAERKNGGYEINFRTAQEGIGTLRVIKGKAPQKKVVFQSVIRKNPLAETPVTEEEMKQIWTSSKMEDEQKQAFLQLQREFLKQQEETKELNAIIVKKQEECVRLEKLLEKAKQEGNANNSELESIRSKYTALNQELSGYIKESTRLSKELENARY